MIRRLVEAHYFQNRSGRVNPARMRFWLLELRTPELLIEVARAQPALTRKLIARRPVLKTVQTGNLEIIERLLLDEEMAERVRDREYWLPLRKELERFRHSKVAERRQRASE